MTKIGVHRVLAVFWVLLAEIAGQKQLAIPPSSRVSL